MCSFEVIYHIPAIFGVWQSYNLEPEMTLTKPSWLQNNWYWTLPLSKQCENGKDYLICSLQNGTIHRTQTISLYTDKLHWLKICIGSSSDYLINSHKNHHVFKSESLLKFQLKQIHLDPMIFGMTLETGGPF